MYAKEAPGKQAADSRQQQWSSNAPPAKQEEGVDARDRT